MTCIVNGNTLSLPFGTKFSVNERINNINSSLTKQINLIKACVENEFFAFFCENDVDFEICCDNREFNRGVCMSLTINDKTHSFYIRPQKLSTFKALETNGRKLHFISQNCDDGRVMVAQTAHKYGISYEMASINCSKIEFRFQVEHCLYQTIESLSNIINISLIGTKLQLFVKTLNGKTITINIGLYNTIYDLKMIIAKQEAIPPKQQRLIFRSDQLCDQKKLIEYNLETESTLHLVLRLLGGNAEAIDKPEFNDKTDFYSTTGKQILSDKTIDVSNVNMSSSQLFSGERGVVCYGEKSNEKFTDYDFKADSNIKAISIVLQLRMQSRFAPI